MDRSEQHYWLHAYTRLPDLLELPCTVVSWDGKHLAPCPSLASWAFSSAILVCGAHYQQAMAQVGCPVLFCAYCGEECVLEHAVQGLCSECAF